MQKFFTMRHWIAIAVYIAINIILTALGMGLPIFSIIAGFVWGLYAAERAFRLYDSINQRFTRILTYILFSAAVTMVLMAVVWGRTIPLLFDPLTDFENIGHPMILYKPRVSYIGWLVLMIFISPFLQFLTSVFSAFLALRTKLSRS